MASKEEHDKRADAAALAHAAGEVKCAAGIFASTGSFMAEAEMRKTIAYLRAVLDRHFPEAKP